MTRTMYFRPFGLMAAMGLALSGCATIQTAPTGAYAVGTSYHVKLGQTWSDVSQAMTGASPKVKVLTLDGPMLNRLYLSDGLTRGEYLIKPARSDHATPPYREGMAPKELVEFVADSVSAQGFERVETQNLRPAKFRDADVIRFDLNAVTQAELEMQGTAQVAEISGKLYVLLYLAPREHYFAASLAEVESIFASVGA